MGPTLKSSVSLTVLLFKTVSHSTRSSPIQLDCLTLSSREPVSTSPKAEITHTHHHHSELCMWMLEIWTRVVYTVHTTIKRLCLHIFTMSKDFTGVCRGGGVYARSPLLLFLFRRPMPPLVFTRGNQSWFDQNGSWRRPESSTTKFFT